MYKFVNNVKKENYDSFIKNYSMASFMQSYNWAEVKNNWDSIKCAVYENDKIVAVCLILVKTILKTFKIFYIPRGYLIDFKDEKLLKFMTDEIKKLAKSKDAFLVKIDPNFCISDDNYKQNETAHNYSEDYEIKHNNLLKMGYKYGGVKPSMHSNFQPQFNMAVSLVDKDNNFLTPEIILKSYKSKFRYYLDDYHTLRGVTYTVTDDVKRVPDLIKMLELTESRKNIKLRDEKYFNRILNNFRGYAYMIFGEVDLKKYLKFLTENNADGKDDVEISKVNELLKSQKTKLVSAALTIFPENETGIRTSEYLYAGNDLYLSKLSVSQGMVFEIIKLSLEKKCHYCNMGGVDGTFEDNLSKFKSKFNPDVFCFTGEYDLIINKFVYFMYNLAMKIKK